MLVTWSWKCLRTACHRASAFARKGAPNLWQLLLRLRPCGRTAPGNFLRWRIAETIWNRSKKFRNRTLSPLMSRLANRHIL